MTDWYDYPQYYDLACRDTTRAEVDFIEAACKKYASFPVRRLLEPGCGSGRLVVELAARGYDVAGFDRNAKALAYLQRKLARRRLSARVSRDDMASFSIPEHVDAAFCTFNTFRHLLTESDARWHLQCMARSLRPGGIYILGFHLLPLDVAEEAEERWRTRHGSTQLHVTLRVIHTDRRRRIERLRIILRACTPQRVQRVCSEFPLRMYTANQFRRLLRSVPVFDLCGVFDFWYDLGHPRQLDNDLIDAVFVLRRKP
jgi:SAM-dependent methyltransferase